MLVLHVLLKEGHNKVQYCFFSDPSLQQIYEDTKSSSKHSSNNSTGSNVSNSKRTVTGSSTPVKGSSKKKQKTTPKRSALMRMSKRKT